MRESLSLTLWETFSIVILVYYVLQFINNIGHKMVILDFTIIVGIFTCLVVPVYFYHNYTKTNFLASTWVKFMFIPSDEYFSFALPAVVAMIAGMKIPLTGSNNKTDIPAILAKLRLYLKGNAKMGFILLAIGLASGFIYLLVPGAVKQIFYLAKQLVYVGMFYIYFSDHPRRKMVMLLSLLLAMSSAIASGMFGEMIFVLSLSLVIILLGVKISFLSKLGFFLIGIFMVLIIQTVKMDYRKMAWKQGEASAVYFTELVIHTINSPASMYTDIQLFKTAVRLNQGWLVARTIYNVPRRFPFANGETVWQSIAATIVPRFLWPDKPEAGGKANLKRFWGFSLQGYSMNIGPLGEGYANFGRTGGVIFMFFYGLFFNVMLQWLIKKAGTHFTLICWLPFLFLYTVGLETDIMTTMNSLVKGIIFMLVVFWIFKKFWNIKL